MLLCAACVENRESVPFVAWTLVMLVVLLLYGLKHLIVVKKVISVVYLRERERERELKKNMKT